jgi:5-methylcytosine-specific restriction endonuclease McrA
MKGAGDIFPGLTDDDGMLEAFFPRYARQIERDEDHPIPASASDPLFVPELNGTLPPGRIAANNARDPWGGTLTIDEWLAILDAFEGCCAYCGTGEGRMVIEHLEPICRGGRTNADNVLPACRRCNKSKGRRSIERWRDSREWWRQFLDRLLVAADRFEARRLETRKP